jgi:Inner membrane protein YgaP-like, transmembrane domain
MLWRFALFWFQEEKVMSVNVGTIDRVLRVVIGLALIAFAIPLGFPQTGWNWLGWIGVVPIITAVVGNCPAYSVLGLSTR